MVFRPLAGQTAYLAARRLGEPQGPLVHERMLHVEVLRVVEHCDVVAICLLGLLLLLGGGNGGRGVLVVHRYGTVFSNSGHGGCEIIEIIERLKSSENYTSDVAVIRVPRTSSEG